MHVDSAPRELLLCIPGVSNLTSAYRGIHVSAICESPHYLMGTRVAAQAIRITERKVCCSYFRRHLHACSVVAGFPGVPGINEKL